MRYLIFKYAKKLPGLVLCICTSSVLAQTASMNYIRTRVPRENITSNTQLDAQTATNDSVMSTIQYMDGLGRPVQTVMYQASPSNKDMVQPQAYDGYGREAVKYLPYAVSTAGASDGSFKTTALTSGNGVHYFYNPSGAVPVTAAQQTNGITVTADPFAVTGYEPSPLNRVVEQGAPGENYQFSGAGNAGSSYHTGKIANGANDRVAFTTVVTNNPGDHIVALYTVTINSDQSRTISRYNDTACYNTGQLNVTITRNENWQPANGCVGTVEEYKDKEGHVVLKRTYDITAAGKIEELPTYYVYDNMGNLCFVLPPSTLPDATAVLNSGRIDNFGYQYRYDYRNRLSQKKLPGQGWMFMVYNTLDQLVMTQTADQRNQTPQKWTFTKYDIQGRVIVTGIYSYPGSAKNNSVDTPDQTEFLALSNTYTGLTQNLWEAVNSSTATGYDGLSYPTGQSFTFLAIDYYDSYTNIPGLPSIYDYHTNPSYSTMTNGLLTASKTYVLNSSDALWSVNYYDTYGMPIRSIKQHYLGGTSSLSIYNYDDITTTYNFNKQPLAVTRLHFNSNNNTSATLLLTVYDTYTYDWMGRKINTYQQLKDHANTTQAKMLVVKNVYNEAGQLFKKELQSLTPFTNYLQTVNYRYTPRGWLSNINNANLTSDGGLTSSDTNDQFGEELYYDHTTSGIPQYNGNIATVKWKNGNTTAGTQNQLGYDYRYDAQNRLIDGVSSTAGTKDGYYDEHIRYDIMGNITTLGRYDQATANTRTQIDSLTYTYGSTNHVVVVNDSAPYTGTLGFNDAVQATTEYTYDIDGNELTDQNKGISAITYNLLNLPQTITMSNGNTEVYIYDAKGTKLRKVSTIGGTASTTEYIDGIEYDPNGTTTPTIAFIQTEEGRARLSGTVYTYETDLKDHLGNTRVTLNLNTSGILQILQENVYYPFGATIGTLYPLAANPKNHYLYNHKEYQDETGLYDYGARFYDHLLGRWTTEDPMMEQGRKESPYGYAFDDPMRFTDPDGMWPDWGEVANTASIVVNKVAVAYVEINIRIGHVVTDVLGLPRSEEVGKVISGHATSNEKSEFTGKMLSAVQGMLLNGEEGGEGFHGEGPKLEIPESNKVDRSQLDPPSKHGNAPTFKSDGTPVEIHHEGQKPEGPFKEMHHSEHRMGENYKNNHPEGQKPLTKGERKQFNAAKRTYWQQEYPKNN